MINDSLANHLIEDHRITGKLFLINERLIFRSIKSVEHSYFYTPGGSPGFLCHSKAINNMADKKIASAVCADSCKAENTSSEMTCKLTSPEFRKRKETVIADLKKQMLERKELSNGYAFKFTGDDEMLDKLTGFIKTERACCDFFAFHLSVSGDKKETWLHMTGAAGAKEFIVSEMGL